MPFAPIEERSFESCQGTLDGAWRLVGYELGGAVSVFAEYSSGQAFGYAGTCRGQASEPGPLIPLHELEYVQNSLFSGVISDVLLPYRALISKRCVDDLVHSESRERFFSSLDCAEFECGVLDCQLDATPGQFTNPDYTCVSGDSLLTFSSATETLYRWDREQLGTPLPCSLRDFTICELDRANHAQSCVWDGSACVGTAPAACARDDFGATPWCRTYALTTICSGTTTRCDENAPVCAGSSVLCANLGVELCDQVSGCHLLDCATPTSCAEVPLSECAARGCTLTNP